MFLNYLMLMGLGAAAVPLVLHLLSRARYRTVDWGAMIFLRGADARHRQASRLNQVFLVLVRMGMIALLAVALARPVVRGNWFGVAREQRLTAAIVLDCSASMAYDENGRSRFELARGVARQVLSSLRRGDRAILVAAGRPANEQDLRPTPELRAVDTRLASLQPAYGSADLFSAMSRAWEQLVEAEPIHRQIYVITDRQAVAWNRAGEGTRAPWLDQPAEAAVQTDVFVIPVGGVEADNVVVESIELLDPPAIRGQPVEIEVKLRNFGPVQRAALPFTIRAGQRKIHEARVNLSPNSSSTFKAVIKEGFPSAGSEVITATVNSTRYIVDDSLQNVIEVIDPVRVLVVSGDERPAGSGGLRGESDFVRVALAPFQTSKGKPGRDPCVIEVKTVEQWSEITFFAYDVVILANVERFDAKQVRELEQFVYGGGGLLLAPGNLSRPDNYNELLYRDGAGLMPAELLPATPGDGSESTTLLGWRPEHPVFRFLRGRPDPMPSSTIGRYFRARPHQPDARSLAEYVSGWPLLVETPRGERERRGRVILMTTPLDTDWGNLPFSNFYLPFTQSLIRYLRGGVIDNRNLTPGEIMQAKLGPSPVNRTVTLQRPGDAKPVSLELIRYGDQAEVRYGDTRMPGEYRMIVSEEGKPPRTVHYVVTPPRDESDLTQLDDTAWQRLEDSLGFRRLDTSEEPIAAVMSASRDGREIWAILLCGVMVLGVMELAMARSFSKVPSEDV
jgi:hypothetical protein